jgi:RimJ/RimL family protein N-acetyltransferase
MITLQPFGQKDFNALISWVDSEEMLYTIAGKDLSYPLTADQLRRYLNDSDSYSFSVVDVDDGTLVGHAEIRSSGRQKCKIDKLIIGHQSKRGHGLGKQIIEQLLAFAFTDLQAEVVELNVFDWNKAGIRCYESCGFVLNPGGSADFQFRDTTWVALNMVIQKTDWENRDQNPGKPA